MDYIIVIPTHNRVDVLQKKTLPLLKRLGIPSKKITLFVSGGEQKKMYQEGVPSSEYNEIISKDVKGIGATKNAITAHYPEGKKIVIVEDDLNNLMKLSSDAKKLVPLTDLDSVIKQGFDLCDKHKTILWGIYAVPNAFFMKPAVSFDLKFIIGTCYGIINTKKIHLHTNVKEDYELSLEVWERYGAIVRFNNIVARRKAYPDRGQGGLADLSERKARTEVSVDYLLKKFPELIHESKKTKLGLREIQMNRGKAVSSGVSGNGKMLDEHKRLVRVLKEDKPEDIKKELSIQSKELKELEGSGMPPQNALSEHDMTDEGIQVLPIRNRAKYNATKQHLLDTLHNLLTVSKIPKPELKRTATNRGNVIGTIGRTMTFGFGDNRHGWNYYATNKKHPEVFKALVEFGNQVVPKGWEYQGITLNHGVKAKKHIDTKNSGKSVIIGIGDFTGGEIKVWKANDTNPVIKNLHDKPVMFNGGILPHETQPFKEGDKYGRYTIIFYKQKRRPSSGKIGVGSGRGMMEPPYGGSIFA